MGRLVVLATAAMGFVERRTPPPPSRASAGSIAPLAVDDLRALLGSIAREGARLRIDAPRVRALTRTLAEQAVELRFALRGGDDAGDAPRQIGLKVCAHDPSNVLYVMWRLDPLPAIVVTVKRSVGASAVPSCRVLVARRAVPPPEVTLGSEHTLRADMNGDTLRVWIDGGIVWEGEMGDDVLALGPLAVGGGLDRATRPAPPLAVSILPGPLDRATRPAPPITMSAFPPLFDRTTRPAPPLRASAFPALYGGE